MIHSIHAPLPLRFAATVTAPEIGTGGPVPVEVVGVSCYPGEQVTFWIRGEGGWLYCYAPVDWFSPWGAATKARSPKAHTGFTIDLPLFE